jgi:hypothetical protein
MEVHLYSSATNHTNGTVLCTYNVAPFVGKHKNEITTTESSGIHDVDVTSIIPLIGVKRVTGSVLACGGENQTGTYTGASTVRAFSDTAHTVPVDLTIE